MGEAAADVAGLDLRLVVVRHRRMRVEVRVASFGLPLRLQHTSIRSYCH